VDDDFSDSVQEQVFLFRFRLCDEREHLVKEEFGVSNSEVAQANRGGLTNFLVLVLEEGLDKAQNVCFS